MKINKEIQNIILNQCVECYPDMVSFDFMKEIKNTYGEDVINVNIYYLQEHGLLRPNAKLANDASGRVICKLPPSATHIGVDFMNNDGGVSAILGTVIVKLHSETLLDLLEMKIYGADIAPKEKSRLVEGLRELPADGIKHLTMKLLDKGLESIPNLIQLIGMYLPPA